MSDEPQAPEAETPEPAAAAEDAPAESGRPQYKRFRRPFNAVRLAPDAAARQGRAASVAYDKFKDFAKVKEFLNAHNDALGGRPIDLAVESAAGLEAVTKLLAES